MRLIIQIKRVSNLLWFIFFHLIALLITRWLSFITVTMYSYNFVICFDSFLSIDCIICFDLFSFICLLCFITRWLSFITGTMYSYNFIICFDSFLSIDCFALSHDGSLLSLAQCIHTIL